MGDVLRRKGLKGFLPHTSIPAADKLQVTPVCQLHLLAVLVADHPKPEIRFVEHIEDGLRTTRKLAYLSENLLLCVVRTWGLFLRRSSM